MRRSRLCSIGGTILVMAIAFSAVAAAAQPAPAASSDSVVVSAGGAATPSADYVPDPPAPNHAPFLLIPDAPPPPQPPPPGAPTDDGAGPPVADAPQSQLVAVGVGATTQVLGRASTTRDTAAPPDSVSAAATEPNLLTKSLATLRGFRAQPELVAFGVLGALAVMLLVLFPVELLNSTLLARYDVLFGWLGRLTPPAVVGLGNRVQARPIIGGITVSVVAAGLFSLNDPEFGFTAASARLFLACLIALFVIGYLASAVTALALRQRWHLATAIQLRPFALLLAALGVAASRLLDFSPGFMVGLVFGLAVTSAGSERDRARAVLVRAGVVLAFGVAAWFGYNALLESGAEESLTFVGPLATETLAAITTEGITALVVGLLPFRLLEGAEVFHESRRLWAASYFVVLVAFSVLVVSSEHNWRVLGDTVGSWLTTLVVFCVVCVAAYLVLRHRGDPPVAEPEEPAAVDRAAS